MRCISVCGIVLALVLPPVGKTPARPPRKVDLQNLSQLDLHNVKAEIVTYLGRSALRIADTAGPGVGDFGRMAVIRQSAFQDGILETDLTGDTAPDAPAELRGFVGIAFRTASDLSHYECLYLRPKNGRSNDQLQRNHAVQYISFPGFSWQKLRSQAPGQYESYVDLEPGRWTHLKIEVKGSMARLYVDHAEQPTLIVNDLKQSPSTGAVGLWIGPGTIAHFANLSIAADK